MTLIDPRLPDRLREMLAQGPERRGRRGRRRFAPDLAYGRHDGPPCSTCRDAAVLILLAPRDQDWVLPLTVRPDHMTTHAGQVSFPGGAAEPGETARQCAIREYTEELGEPPPSLRVLGQLNPVYVFASDFLVTPVVAAASAFPDFRPNPLEVAGVVSLPVSHLLDERNLTEMTIERPGIRFSAPAVRIAGHRVWGATALMLGELSELLREIET